MHIEALHGPGRNIHIHNCTWMVTVYVVPYMDKHALKLACLVSTRTRECAWWVSVAVEPFGGYSKRVSEFLRSRVSACGFRDLVI